MDVLFLDVDGVLNNSTVTRNGRFDPLMVAVLKKILEATGMKIVVSSSIRKHKMLLKQLQQLVGPQHFYGKTRIIDNYGMKFQVERVCEIVE